MLKIGFGNTVSLTKGDTAYLKVDIKNDVSGEAYTVQEGDTLTMTVKKDYDSSPAFQKKIHGDVEFHIKPEDTGGLETGKYKYDVQLDTANGDVFTVIPPSTFEILEEVT